MDLKRKSSAKKECPIDPNNLLSINQDQEDYEINEEQPL